MCGKRVGFCLFNPSRSFREDLSALIARVPGNTVNFSRRTSFPVPARDIAVARMGSGRFFVRITDPRNTSRLCRFAYRLKSYTYTKGVPKVMLRTRRRMFNIVCTLSTNKPVCSTEFVRRSAGGPSFVK